MIIKAEDYYSDRLHVLNEAFMFLDISNLSSTASNFVQTRRPSNQMKYSPMFSSSKELLDVFFKPLNKHLEHILERKFWS
ncbi:hypothetical protein LSH36_2666g00001 [Paralvinella palmiformis]|uniref:Uncharacterized protein n=1 Tax=Paralvinella palmiformis TaxID=53620 RepID=A0AAD9MLC7_9ANNE|nr:hypothetical protein LSH36_2666g00001 [Paralvinella palmiformis]